MGTELSRRNILALQNWGMSSRSRAERSQKRVEGPVCRCSGLGAGMGYAWSGLGSFDRLRLVTLRQEVPKPGRQKPVVALRICFNECYEPVARMVYHSPNANFASVLTVVMVMLQDIYGLCLTFTTVLDIPSMKVTVVTVISTNWA
jgi:hypothetical protein